MTRKIILLVLLCVGIQAHAQAAGAGNSAKKGISQSDFYIGAGLGINSVSGFDDGTGFQVYGGYNLPIHLAGATHSVEVGYMDSGDFDQTFLTINPLDPFGPLVPFTVSEKATGVWGTYTFIWPANDTISLIGRGGLDLGDDDGLMIGGGVEFNFNAPVKLRAELVMRDNIDSIQVNVVYQL